VLEKLALRMVENGVDLDIANQICEDLESFANYGFPESHAWSFALIAYATAYPCRARSWRTMPTW
jgi:error-prone DNA polymerase